MLKNISTLECQIGEKWYRLLCDMDSPLPDVKECLIQFQRFVQQIEEDVKKERERLEKEKKDKENEQLAV